MTINPLIPYLPAFLSFFIYGVAIAGLFRYGKRGGRGCLFPLIFWYGFAILAVFLALLVSVQDTTNQVSFAVGLLVPFARSMWGSEAVQASLAIVATIIDFIRHTAWQIGRLWQAWQTKRAETPKHGQEGRASEQQYGHTNQSNHQSQQENTNAQAQAERERQQQARQEQASREAEARSRREQAERERQDQQSTSKPKPPPDTDDDPRDPIAVLGLKSGYTDEELRTAYKREAGRTHPDKWIGKPEAIRQMMEAEYKAIQEAYRILQNRRA